jgi:uncharacterized protein YdcH (DUF465 family)
MHIEHHPLIKEFPEHRERIHELKQSNNHFAKLADQYEEVDKHICRAEDSPEGYDNQHMHELKSERLKLKDEMFRILEGEAA